MRFVSPAAPPRHAGPPLALSLGLHVAILVVLGFVWTGRRGTDHPVEEREIGVTIVERLPDRERYHDLATDVTEPESADASPGAPASPDDLAASQIPASPDDLAPPDGIAPPLDLDGMLRAMDAMPAPAGATGLAGDSRLGDDAFGGDPSTSGTGTLAGSQATAMLFGVSGTGSRFVYVFDRSNSMNAFGGSPLRAAKAELARSLESLTEKQQFQLIFYNDTPKPFQLAGMPLQMIPGEPSMIAAAQRYVESVRAFGGTEHDAALKMALRMSPDVIFFLTDGRVPQLSVTQLAEIRNRASRNGTTIHAIEFGLEPSAPRGGFLRDLAAQNGGRYQYIDVATLRSGSR